MVLVAAEADTEKSWQRVNERNDRLGVSLGGQASCVCMEYALIMWILAEFAFPCSMILFAPH